MNTPRLSRPWRTAFVVGLLMTVVGACSSTFPLTLRSTSPQGVASVLVLFGNEAEFEGKASTAEIASVIQPSKLNGYYGYAEFDVVAGDAGPEWTERSSHLKALKATCEPSKGAPQELRFQLPRSTLDLHPDLGIAVVVRTSDREYRMRRWQHAAIVKADGTLVVDATAREISGSY